jgi:hypothetical protein
MNRDTMSRPPRDAHQCVNNDSEEHVSATTMPLPESAVPTYADIVYSHAPASLRVEMRVPPDANDASSRPDAVNRDTIVALWFSPAATQIDPSVRGMIVVAVVTTSLVPPSPQLGSGISAALAGGLIASVIAVAPMHIQRVRRISIDLPSSLNQ